MTRPVLALYSLLSTRLALLWALLVGVTLALVAGVLSMRYEENISDFLPLADRHRTAMAVYQDVSGAGRVYAVITGSPDDPDATVETAARLADAIAGLDTLGYISSMTATVDSDIIDRTLEAVNDLMPYLLTDGDYDRIDSLLASPGLADERLTAAREMLQMPGSSMAAATIATDPLGLFTPVLSRLEGSARGVIDVDTYEDCIMSSDRSRAFIMMESAFGPNESDNNDRLAAMLDEASRIALADAPGGITVDFIGSPVIAAANARCIKHDSLLTGSVACVLIMLLLVYVFRSGRNILLIFLSVGWGWLFAMGALSLHYDTISVIVVGMTSIMLGIAVNYPLHLIDHISDTGDTRRALGQIVGPLVIGNVTTVGAFLCLVPLDSRALHDLGLFSALLLVGTILFVLIFLPHAVSRREGRAHAAPLLISRLAVLRPERHRAILPVVAVITVILGWFSLDTSFDPDLRHINYLTPGQREQFDYLNATLSSSSASDVIYVTSTGTTLDEALDRATAASVAVAPMLGDSLVSEPADVTRFLVAPGERHRRAARWNSLAARRDSLLGTLGRSASRHGFRDGAFTRFADMLHTVDADASADIYTPLTATIFSTSLSVDTAAGRYTVVRHLHPVGRVSSDSIISGLSRTLPTGSMAFDVTSMNSALTGTLAVDFNYIGIACGAIVFLFLWLSLGRVELAMLSFLPMALSWVWILGLMGIFGLRFNIVNVILATFIFGQGDDYTIFITEGLSYELAYGRRVLASYKNSIIVSALIMFIGIGTLVFATHPALRSLGQVTVVGMTSVVLMAWLIPPLIFNFLVMKRGHLRPVPLTLGSIMRRALRLPPVTRPDRLVYMRYIYKGVDIARDARRALRRATASGPVAEPGLPGSDIRLTDTHGRGELALLTALTNPTCRVTVSIPDPDRRDVCIRAARGFVDNLTVIP